MDTMTPQRVTQFWMLVDRAKSDDWCWLWTGYSEKGYGRFFDGNRMRGAHDLALEFASGERRLPDQVTCHSCHTPLCCNPRHLRYDSIQANNEDMMRAGRHRAVAKLTDQQVETIRRRSILGGATGRSLAFEYGVSESLITEILRGKRRKSAPGPIRGWHGNTKRVRSNNQGAMSNA